MTLLDAKQYDPEKGRKRRNRILSATLVVVVLGFLAWIFRYWPQEHTVGHFFQALQKQDYNRAYGIWMHDPEWQAHPQQHAKYPFNDFYRDWGPGGEWGLVKSYKVYGASKCPTLGGNFSSGVVIDVVVNDRTEHAQVWYENSNDTLGYPPCELLFH
jgi:hypothetical protein